MTGSSIVDAVFQNIEIAKRHGDALSRFGLAKGKYFLLTVHRAENVDVQSRLEGIIYGLPAIQKEFNLPVIFPIHPRKKKMMLSTFGISTGGSQIIPLCRAWNWSPCMRVREFYELFRKMV